MTTTAELPAPPASELAELNFRFGLPGFPGGRRFTLVRWGDENSPFSILADLDDAGVRFLVVPPTCFFPDYAPELDDATVAKAGLESAEEALILVIVSLGETAQDATANLLGPIVVNLRTLEGVQAVLATSDYGTQVRLAG